MNNKALPKFVEKLISPKKALLTNLDCVPMIRKGFIGHVTLRLLAIKEKGIYRLDRCLRDLMTKNH